MAKQRVFPRKKFVFCIFYGEIFLAHNRRLYYTVRKRFVQAGDDETLLAALWGERAVFIVPELSSRAINGNHRKKREEKT